MINDLLNMGTVEQTDEHFVQLPPPPSPGPALSTQSQVTSMTPTAKRNKSIAAGRVALAPPSHLPLPIIDAATPSPATAEHMRETQVSGALVSSTGTSEEREVASGGRKRRPRTSLDL